MSLDKIKILRQRRISLGLKKATKDIITHFDPQAEIEVEIKDSGARINIETEMSGLLIGRRGETLQALEHILRLVLASEMAEFIPILVDVAGYRASSEKGIEDLARGTAAKVLHFDLPEALRPMNAYERRLAHLVLSEIEGIEALSEGEEPYRRIVIRPQKKQK